MPGVCKVLSVIHCMPKYVPILYRYWDNTASTLKYGLGDTQVIEDGTTRKPGYGVLCAIRSNSISTQYTNVTDRQTPSHRTSAKAALMHSIARQKKQTDDQLWHNVTNGNSTARCITMVMRHRETDARTADIQHRLTHISKQLRLQSPGGWRRCGTMGHGHSPRTYDKKCHHRNNPKQEVWPPGSAITVCPRLGAIT